MRRIVPLKKRIGLIFRGFSGTVDPIIILPLLRRGVPTILGSRVRLDIVSNVMRQMYATDKELLKAGVIYSEDMTEDLLVSKLSIVLGLLHQYLKKYKRKDIVKNSQKYMYLIKLLMLINFKGEITLMGKPPRGREPVLPECRYNIEEMAEYLAKNGFKSGEEIFTERNDYTKYFYYLRKYWFMEKI